MDVTITEDTFSLLKFPNQEMDFSLRCLAGNLTTTSEYITVFPVKCNKKIANSYICTSAFLQCHKNSVEEMDLLFDPVFEQDLNNSLIIETNQVVKTLDSVDGTKMFKNIFRALWSTSLPCFDLNNLTANKEGDKSILKYCEWKGVKMPCSSIFTTFQTDRGMCCSFNMKAAEEVFNGKTYPKLVQTMQMEDKKVSFDQVKTFKTYFYNKVD